MTPPLAGQEIAPRLRAAAAAAGVALSDTTPAVKRPSAWKLLKAVGGAPFATSFNAQLAQEADPAAIGIHASPAPTYRLPFTFALDSDLITWGELIVTKPAGAFQLTAGILGLVVVHPEDPQRVAQLSVIATNH